MRDQIKISLLERIKSDTFMLYAAMFTVAFLAPNTYYVYYSFCVFASPWRELASAGVACIVSASILIYTLRKNFRVAKYYSIFEVSISAYYYINTIGWDWGLIPALGFTLILPVSIYYYSKEIESGSSTTVAFLTEELQKAKDVYNNLIEDFTKVVQLNIDLENSKKRMQEQAGKAIEELTILSAKIDELQAERDHYKGLHEVNKETYVQLSGRGNRIVPVENQRLNEEGLIDQQPEKLQKLPVMVTELDGKLRMVESDNEKFIAELAQQEQPAKPKGGAKKSS